MALYHNTLTNYYVLNFALMQHHKYSLTEIEDMIPWEREIYVKLLTDHLRKVKEKQDAAAISRR